MKKTYTVFISALSLLLAFAFTTVQAQTFEGDWTVKYATADNGDNGTGNRTLAITSVEEDAFAALVTAGESYCYLVSYRNADSLSGRLGDYPYSADLFTTWSQGFSQVQMNLARDLVNDGNIVYVTNNDEDHNILSFELKEDSIYSHTQRLETGSETIWGLDKDDNGYFYVTQAGNAESAGKVLVYEGPELNSAWEGSNSLESVTEFEIPANGSLRGVAVNSDGSVVYVSNFHERKVYCYTGSPEEGYSMYDDFNFEMTGTFTASSETEYEPSPFGLQYMNEKNILFVTAGLDDDSLDYNGDFPEYGKIFAVNPNDGSVMDTIDVAQWNLQVGGNYTNTEPGTCSGYTSVYNMDYDANLNLYNVSFYGWSVEKRIFSGDLPNVELTIVTDVEQISSQIPEEFKLSENYPNPFNPSTTIEFSLNDAADVSLDIYTITGEHVATLVNGKHYKAGVYEVSFNAENLASGTYIYSLTKGDQQISKKMTLIK